MMASNVVATTTRSFNLAESGTEYLREQRTPIEL